MPSRRLAYLGVLCLTLFLANRGPAQGAPSAAPKPARSILICYFTSPTDYQSRSVGAALGRMLRYRASNLSQLSNLPPLNVVERAMREEKLTGRLSLKPMDALKVARATGQEWFLVGSVKRFGAKFLITAEMYGASAGTRIGRPISLSGAEADLPRLEVDLARSVFNGAGLQLTAQQRAELGKPLTNNPKAMRLLGDFLLANRKAAPGFLGKLVATDPYFPLGAVHKADQLLESQRNREVIPFARQWSARLPQNRDFPSYEFGALMALGRYDEASAVLTAIEANYPNSFSVTLLRHWLDRLQGDTAGALKIARKLTALNPESSEGYARVALASLEHGFRIGQNQPMSGMNPGTAGEIEADIETARLSGEQAVRIDPKYEDVWLALMVVYREQGRYDRSREAYRKIMGLNAANSEAASSQAVTYLCRNDVKSACKLWEHCLSTNPRQTDAMVGLALCGKMSGNPKMTEKFVRRALAVDAHCLDSAHLRYREYWPVEIAQAAGGLMPGG